MEKIKIELVDKDAKMPTRADKGSAGYDLYVPRDVIVFPGRNLIPTGLKMEIPFGWEGHIRPRSGFSFRGIEAEYPSSNHTKANFDADAIQGTIDSSYRGVVGLIIKSYETKPFFIPAGTRVAQIVFERCYTDELVLVDKVSENSERGEEGFGHSGVK